MGKGNKRRPSPSSTPQLKEPPRKLPELPGSNTSGERLCWRFSHVDHEGPWNFDGLDDGGWRELMRCLANFETMTMGEAFPGNGYPGKDYNVDEIPTAAARDRLDAIGLADMTKISRFRLSGEQRLYGFRCNNVFHVVWRDPNHEVWPSSKKHT